MEKHIFELKLGEYSVRILLKEVGAARFFAVPLHPCSGTNYDIQVTEEQKAQKRSEISVEISEALLEFKLMVSELARFLLPRKACLIHAVAVLWQDKAWLLCGPSGIGKTTCPLPF